MKTEIWLILEVRVNLKLMYEFIKMNNYLFFNVLYNFTMLKGFVAQRFEIQSPLIEPNLRRNLGKWST